MNDRYKALVEQVRKNKKNILIAGLVLGAGALGFYGYSVYKNSQEETASKEFMQALAYVNAPVGKQRLDEGIDLEKMDKNFETEQAKWEHVEQVFTEGASKNSGSNYVPLFLIYASEAQGKLGKSSQAITTLEKAVKGLSSNRQLKDLYAIKLAQMKLDSSEPALQTQGITLLEEMARDDKGPLQDTILYVLGDYYWHTKDFTHAQNYWNQLTLKFGTKDENPSVWVRKASERLQLLVAGK
jgi:predicted negative regulator of RcsB-dependent stress response